jgi:hypothetical protein
MLTEKTPQRIKCEGRVVGSVAVHATVWWLSTWRHDELGIPIPI